MIAVLIAAALTATLAGLVTGTPELRTFGALAVIAFSAVAYLKARSADAVEVEPEERDWQWPAKIRDAA